MAEIRTRIPCWFRRTFGFRCPRHRWHGKMKLMHWNRERGIEIWGCELCNADKSLTNPGSVWMVYTKEEK